MGKVATLTSIGLAAALFGCATQPKMLWIRTDGQVMASSPVYEQQFQVDNAICAGEVSKADMSGTVFASGGLAGAIAANRRGQEGASVAQGCMAQHGYLLVREDELEQRRAEALAAHPPPPAPPPAVTAAKKQANRASAPPPVPAQ